MYNMFFISKNFHLSNSNFLLNFEMSILHYLKKSLHIILYVDLRLHLELYVRTSHVMRYFKGSSVGLSLVCVHTLNTGSYGGIVCMSSLTQRQNCKMILNEVSLSAVVLWDCLSPNSKLFWHPQVSTLFYIQTIKL